jgi:DNA primase
MALPPAFLDRLRSHFLLSELIGRRMPLKKHGREYMGLCPFHGEKTPSFTVNNEKGFFHCFGCAAHGDAIEFVKRYDRLEWREAVEKLAREAGLELPAYSREHAETAARQKQLIDATEAAAAWFERQLVGNGGLGARDYLHGRGLTPDTWRRFRLGYAPDSREGLKKHLLAEGFNEAQLVEAGLIIKSDSGATYDRFRARIIFPIRNPAGKVIAFGGRLMGDAAPNLPKYLNSPETPLFHKGEMLFNLDLAGAPAREKSEIVIVEGYMDVIAMAQAGVVNAVATLGTAVTEAHLTKLWHYAPEPVLCLDGDNAGKRAMTRASELVLPLLKPGNALRFAVLPRGEDPDSLIRNHGVDALRETVRAAQSLPDVLWRQWSAQAAATPDAQAKLEHTVMQLAGRIGDPTVREHYKAFFKRQLWQKPPDARSNAKDGQRHQRPSQREAAPRGVAPDARLKTVRQLLKLLLLQPQLLRRHEVEEHVARMDCVNATLGQLRQALLDWAMEDRNDDASAVQALLNESGFAHAVASLLRDEGLMIPRTAHDNPADARRVWQQLVDSQTLHSLEAEYRALEQGLHHSMDEAALERMLEAQRQLKEFKQKRTFSSFDEINSAE